MSVTYCTDADVDAELPIAASLLLRDGDTMDRLRVRAYERINRELARRSPAVLPANLSDRTQLMACEVYAVISELCYGSASRPGYESDHYAQEGKRYYTMHLHELKSPIGVSGDVSTMFSIRLERG